MSPPCAHVVLVMFPCRGRAAAMHPCAVTGPEEGNSQDDIPLSLDVTPADAVVKGATHNPPCTVDLRSISLY